MNTYRNPGRCRQPGHRGRGVAGCPTCRAWWAWERRTRKRRDHVPSRRPPAATLARIAELRAGGMTYADIAADSGISRRHLCDLVHRTPDAVLADTEAAILGVRPHPPRYKVDAVGTRRRLQALAAIGYPLDVLADQLGVIPARVWYLANRSRSVTPALADRIAEVYDRCSMTPGPSAQSRATATRRHRWAPPLAWDDDTIDDPDAQPWHDVADDQADDPDESAVLRALTGDPSTLTRHVDRREAIRRLREVEGLTPREIAGRLGMERRAVEQTIRRHQMQPPSAARTAA